MTTKTWPPADSTNVPGLMERIRRATGAPAESAAESALTPTVKSLQASACDLLDRMIAVTEVDGER